MQQCVSCAAADENRRFTNCFYGPVSPPQWRLRHFCSKLTRPPPRAQRTPHYQSTARASPRSPTSFSNLTLPPAMFSCRRQEEAINSPCFLLPGSSSPPMLCQPVVDRPGSFQRGLPPSPPHTHTQRRARAPPRSIPPTCSGPSDYYFSAFCVPCGGLSLSLGLSLSVSLSLSPLSLSLTPGNPFPPLLNVGYPCHSHLH